MRGKARRSPQTNIFCGNLRIVLCDLVFIGLLLRFVTLPVTNWKCKKILWELRYFEALKKVRTCADTHISESRCGAPILENLNVGHPPIGDPECEGLSGRGAWGEGSVQGLKEGGSRTRADLGTTFRVVTFLGTVEQMKLPYRFDSHASSKAYQR